MQGTENSTLVQEEGLDSSDSRVYEVGYLLIPTIPEEDLTVHWGNLKEFVLSSGGEIIFDEVPKMRALAYSMQKVTANVRNKFDTAYFGWTKFTMDALKIAELKKKLDLDPNFLRFLIIKTVRENTMAVKRFSRGDSYARVSTTKKRIENKEVTPIDKEEVDKEIDALIAV